MATIDIGIIVTAMNRATQGLTNASNDVKRLGDNAQATSNRLRAIDVVLASIGTQKIFEIGQKFLDTAANIEQTRTRLSLIIGSFQTAGDVVEELEKKFGGTGVKAEALAQALIRISSTGLPVDEAMQLVDAIGLVNAAGDRLPASIENAATAFTKLLQKGDVDARTLIGQLGKEMPDALNLMAGAARDRYKDVASFEDAVGRGAISALEAMHLFVQGARAAYPNILDAQKKSIGGALDLVRSAWADTIRQMSNNTPINDAIVERLTKIRDVIDNLVSRVTVEQVTRFFDVLDNMGRVAAGLGPTLGTVASAVAQIAGKVSDLLAALPAEALAAGLIGYLFLGKLGAAAGAAIMTSAVGVGADTKKVGLDIKSFVDQNFEFGLVGYLFLGAKGAALFTAIGAISRKGGEMIAETLNDAMATGHPAARTKWAYDFVKGIVELKDKLTNQVTPAIKDFKTNLDAAQQGTGGTLLPGVDKARKDVSEFVEQLNKLDPGLQSNTANTGAYAAVLEHWNELASKNIDVTAMATRAKELDAAAARTSASATTQLGNAMEEAAKKAKTNRMPLGDSRETETFKENQLAVYNQIKAKIDDATNARTRFEAAARGDLGAEKMAEVNQRWDDYKQKLVQARDELTKQVGKYPELKGMITQINAELERGNQAKDIDVQKTTLILSLTQQRLLLEQKALSLRADMAALELKQNYTNDPLFNLLKGTSGGQIMLQVEQQRIQLQQQIVQYDQQINAELEKRANTIDKTLIANIDAVIQKYQTLKASTQDAIANLSAAGVAQNQLWQSVGSTIENGLANAMTGLITRTQTLAQVGQQVFMAITQAASKYLIQLLLIKSASMFSGMGGGGILSSLFGAADGAAFSGTIKPFANGGIIGGPTLFGIAGEAGAEAIMPLERIGGKLGVRTTGGGGDTIHLHLNAIDTQSGTEFLLKNADTISSQIAARKTRNRKN